MILDNLYLAFAKHREKTGESRGKIGLRIGVTESNLSKIVHGKAKATPEERAAIARELGADEEYLFVQDKD